MAPLLRNMLFALGTALVAWLGYVYFIQDSEMMVSVDGATPSPALQDAQELLVSLRQLKEIHIPAEVFTDARFESLIDFRQEILEEPRGRENPFLPFTTTSE